jgi:hypothetical protein
MKSSNNKMKLATSGLGTTDGIFRSGESLMIRNPEKMPEYSTNLKKEYQTSVEEKRKTYQKWIPATFYREYLDHNIFIVPELNGKHKQVTIPKERTDLVKKNELGGKMKTGGGVGKKSTLNELLQLKKDGVKNISLNGFTEDIDYVINLKLDDSQISKADEKSYMTLYATGGGVEGSERVIGKTKSGKDIYSNPDSKNHEDFTYQDHQDAKNVNEKIKRDADKQVSLVEYKHEKGLNLAEVLTEYENRPKSELWYHVNTVKRAINSGDIKEPEMKKLAEKYYESRKQYYDASKRISRHSYLQKKLKNSQNKMATGGGVGEKDLVYFTIDNDSADSLLHENFKRYVDYEHLDNGDVLYKMERRNFERFEDLASSTSEEFEDSIEEVNSNGSYKMAQGGSTSGFKYSIGGL